MTVDGVRSVGVHSLRRREAGEVRDGPAEELGAVEVMAGVEVVLQLTLWKMTLPAEVLRGQERNGLPQYLEKYLVEVSSSGPHHRQNGHVVRRFGRSHVGHLVFR